MQGNTEVRFDLPEYVKLTEDAFDGQPVTVEYDSNFGGTQTVTATAQIDEGCHAREWTHLVVGDRKIRSNGHVYSTSDDRHLGTVENVTVTVPEEVAVRLVTEGVDHDVDRGGDEVIVQTWDKSVMETQGFMEGTDEIRMERV